MDYYRFCKGNGVAVNAVFYSSLIDGLGKVGRVDEAERLFEEMAEEGVRRIRIVTMLSWMEDGARGCEHTVYTFTILISELFKKRRNEEALKPWEEMIDKGVTPNAACFGALSFGPCLSGKVARACGVLDELAPMGIVRRERKVRIVLINALRKAGNADLAIKLMHSKIGIGYDRMRSVKKRVKFQTLFDN
ncbi:hypothetical protein ACSQ67_024032 [Phaseolus vulgaris]